LYPFDLIELKHFLSFMNVRSIGIDIAKIDSAPQHYLWGIKRDQNGKKTLS
jgi:hypothetical protein